MEIAAAGTWHAAARLRLDDARGCPSRRHAAPRPAAGPARSRVRPSSAGPAAPSLPPTSGRTASAARFAPIPPQHVSGAATRTTTASGRRSSWDSAGSSTAEPLIVLAAPGTKPEQVQYAMDWVHYLNDPPTTEWGRLRASNGHPEPYGVRYFQIDNEPMNQRLHAGEVRRDRQRLRQPVAGHRSQGANRGVRTEAVQRHGLEPEGHRPRRKELRRPRRVTTTSTSPRTSRPG